MALTIAGAAAGSAALAAYLDAKFHIRNDIRGGSTKMRALGSAKLIMEKHRQGKTHIYHTFESHANSSKGDLTFLVFEGREWTYKDIFKAIQPVGNWLMKDLGIEKGEMVALDGGNSPEFILVWLALEAIGAPVAFINCNLTGQPLVHSVKVAKARYLLSDSDVRPLISPVEEELASSGTKTIYYSPEFISTLKDTEMLPASRRANVTPNDVGALIYTSGTTGKPKGTVITRARWMLLENSGLMMGLKPGERMYTCLPLYHAAAQGLCCLPCAGVGATMVLSRRFSHKTFWPEVHASKATRIQYVGELTRYLLNAEPSPLDKGHHVYLASGNGMRPDIWEAFRERININRGDFGIGAIAIRGPIFHLLNGSNEVRVHIDPDTQEIIRGKNGFAIKCKTNEPGEMIARVDPASISNPGGTPKYYGNAEAGEKRLVRDVFAKGDIWFRSGDAMRLDPEGRLFFVDRLGDTFRWHSENVSTTEVENAASSFPQVAEVNVYGVAVPNTEGRAGCMAIVAAEGVSTTLEDIESGRGLDLKGLAEHCLAELPRYAVPIFVRVVKELEYTGTMKIQKGRLRAEGIELEAIEKAAKEKGAEVDAIYWLPPGGKAYVPFRNRELQELKSGTVRL
ncbi:fatty acid transporter [Hypoxylon trugodes]|uniref:fatty acid transporter n=1 Tax=Hypoxylon trugodes TaxID=326681 RepID=UPI002194F279|nr:fatty acid transporter [Hypoxylon trugodes]KAI1392515.1 fatty acid transporter [Hypoxylon trugodes]